jgi:hypothetical protein
MYVKCFWTRNLEQAPPPITRHAEGTSRADHPIRDGGAPLSIEPPAAHHVASIRPALDPGSLRAAIHTSTPPNPERTMQQPRTYDHIWYRDRPETESRKSDPFTRERGRLVVEGDGIRFEGPKTSVVLRDVEAVEYGVHGTMTNPSIHVRYRDGGDARSAWFTDGRLGGYSGMFGGTRKLAQELSHLAPTTFEDAAASRSQNRLAWIIGAAVLFFLVRALRAILERG